MATKVNCDVCNELVENTKYMPSEYDKEKHHKGWDICIECYDRVEHFEFVEYIKDYKMNAVIENDWFNSLDKQTQNKVQDFLKERVGEHMMFENKN
tara:strand:- start:296 stop:583 length:288 start_codon:yes stop_codon:yes gene_type:complete